MVHWFMPEPELPPIPIDEAVETVKRVAITNPCTSLKPEKPKPLPETKNEGKDKKI